MISCLFAIKRLIFLPLMKGRGAEAGGRFMHQGKRSDSLPPFSFTNHHHPSFMLTPAVFFPVLSSVFPVPGHARIPADPSNTVGGERWGCPRGHCGVCGDVRAPQE